MIQSREAATVLARQSVRLPGDPASASAARRAVREVLRAAGRTEWLHAAELASTEVVSNAVLHAHTEVELTVEVFDDVVRVQVRDFSPLLPVQRDYSAQATTGRGMALVAALTTEHGVTDVGPTGKTVWFTVGRTAVEQSDEELVAAWDDADWDLAELMRGSTASGPGAVRTVRLLGLPPLLWLAAREHHDALLRELVLHLAEHGDVASEVDVPATDRARAQVSTAVVEALEEARRAGTASRALPAGHPSPLPDVPGALDLELQLPTDVGRAFTAMQDTLDAAEELAGAGQLLVRPALPEIIAVRDWVCDQVTAQLAGVAPSTWPGAAQERFTVAGRGSRDELTDWDVALVRDSPRRVVAADDANRIIAISAPLADALGWAADDLVGRRVVTLIPTRLREAHVAGFTRHLTTGEAHVLDVPLVLPVLHADGTELAARFLIQKAPSEGGRAVYVASIDPVPATSP